MEVSWLGGSGQLSTVDNCLCAYAASCVCQDVLPPTRENAGRGLSWNLNGQSRTAVLSPSLGCTVICLGALT